MRSNDDNIAGNSQPTTPVLKRAVVAFILIVIVGLVFAPADKAVARGAYRNDNVHQYNWDRFRQGREIEIEVSVELTDRTSPDFTFKDEESGVSLSHYPARFVVAGADPKEFVAPDIEALVLYRGEECLHGEGSCEACDRLRDMYHSGEVNSLYRVGFYPDVEGEEEYSLTVPLDEEVPEYAVYRCVGGNLETSYSHISDSSDSDSGSSTVLLRGSPQILQSPYGVANNVSRPEDSKTMSVHAYTPDDDEPDDDEPSLLDKILGFLMVVAGLAAYIAVVTFAMMLWEKIKYRLFVNRLK